MASTPIESVAEAIQEVVGTYEPENLESCGRVFPDLSQCYSAQADSIKALADHLEGESPLHPELIESLREQAAVLAGLADKADEGHSSFERLHKEDLERIREPRAGEHMADYTAHQ